MLNVVVDLAQEAVDDEGIGVGSFEKRFEVLDGGVFVDEGGVLGGGGARELQAEFKLVLEGGFEPKEEFLLGGIVHGG